MRDRQASYTGKDAKASFPGKLEGQQTWMAVVLPNIPCLLLRCAWFPTLELQAR
jgi:hypothetical protein